MVENKKFEGAKKALKPSVYLAHEAWWGRIDKVKKLLKNNQFSESTLTRALMQAAYTYKNNSNYVEGSHDKICKLLLERGADPHFSFNSKGNKTAYTIAQNRYSDSMKAVFYDHDKKIKNLKENSSSKKRKNKKRNGAFYLFINFVIRSVKRIMLSIRIIKNKLYKDRKGKSTIPKGKKVFPTEFTLPKNSTRTKQRKNKPQANTSRKSNKAKKNMHRRINI